MKPLMITSEWTDPGGEGSCRDERFTLAVCPQGEKKTLITSFNVDI